MSARNLFNEIIDRGLYDNYVKLASFLYREKKYSLFNSAMIVLQRPNARYIETKHRWEKDYNRLLKPESVPIVILQPFAPIEFVYDLEDTYGDKEPEYIKNAFVFPKLRPLEDKDLSYFINIVNKLGIYYSEKPLGSICGGYATLLNDSIGVQVSGSKYIDTRYVVIINSRLEDSQKAAAILHEVGHVLCGHVGQDKDNKYIKVPIRNELNHNIEEYEAETMCKILSRVLNIQSNSEIYLKEYSSKGSSFDIIIRAVDKVLSVI